MYQSFTCRLNIYSAVHPHVTYHMCVYEHVREKTTPQKHNACGAISLCIIHFILEISIELLVIQVTEYTISNGNFTMSLYFIQHV